MRLVIRSQLRSRVSEWSADDRSTFLYSGGHDRDIVGLALRADITLGYAAGSNMPCLHY
jgi:hypothetical protein